MSEYEELMRARYYTRLIGWILVGMVAFTALILLLGQHGNH